MTVLSTTRHPARNSRRPSRNSITPLLLSGTLAAGAIALVGYLLWPTWGAPELSGNPEQLPVSVGDTLFNVPTRAFRIKIQRHSGPQERIDLDFLYPSLEPPPAHVNAGNVEAPPAPIDRIFLSIAAHHDASAPETLVRTIYPRYLDQTATTTQDGLTMRAFRDGTPYAGEDLFLADDPDLATRCTRDAATPGMCLSMRRIDGADLTFRFPRSWLAHWRDVADATARLTLQLHGTGK
jgi:hypothetical protein